MEKETTKLYKGTSKRAKSLLARQEGLDVEFKRKINGLEPSDLVAFANSERGGAILIGVEETKSEVGLQKAKILGCKIGDSERLTILNKAEDCVPPIDLEIVFENVNSGKPFIRVEIPPGNNKPYCTKQGLYKIRGDGRTKALLPGRLLSLFMETEAEVFLARFREATKNLEHSLSQSMSNIEDDFQRLEQYVETMGLDLEQSLEPIFESTIGAQELSEEALSLSDSALGGVEDLHSKLEDLDWTLERTDDKVDGILQHLGIEDPYFVRLRTNVQNYARELLKKNPDMNTDELANQVGTVFLVPFDFIYRCCLEITSISEDES